MFREGKSAVKDDPKENNTLMKREKKHSLERILAEHLERSDFCDFEKPRKRTNQEEKKGLSSRAMREISRNQLVKKSAMPDRVEGIREVIVARIVIEPGLGLFNSSKIN